jgi:hypothetical protein
MDSHGLYVGRKILGIHVQHSLKHYNASLMQYRVTLSWAQPKLVDGSKLVLGICITKPAEICNMYVQIAMTYEL